MPHFLFVVKINILLSAFGCLADWYFEMELKEFIENFANQFEDTDFSEFNKDTEFQELEEWSSLTALDIIALVRTTYGKKITALDIRSCRTVGELFDLISKR